MVAMFGGVTVQDPRCCMDLFKYRCGRLEALRGGG
jgi:hypothetical protein